MLSIVLERSLANPTEELEASFLIAYETTLKPYHNMFMKAIFSVFFHFFFSDLLTYSNFFLKLKNKNK